MTSMSVQGVVSALLERRKEVGHEFTGCAAVCPRFLAPKAD